MTLPQMVRKHEVILILARKTVCTHVNKVTCTSVRAPGRVTAFKATGSLTWALVYWLRVNGMPQKKYAIFGWIFLRARSITRDYNVLRWIRTYLIGSSPCMKLKTHEPHTIHVCAHMSWLLLDWPYAPRKHQLLSLIYRDSWTNARISLPCTV